jgi:hypothetical protein
VPVNVVPTVGFSEPLDRTSVAAGIELRSNQAGTIVATSNTLTTHRPS